MRSEPIKYSHVDGGAANEFPPCSNTSRRPLPPGWTFGLLSATVLGSLVFLINLVFSIVTVAKHGYAADGRQTLYDGSCNNARRLNIGVHVLINVFSTALLGASNYAMQCLVAPTRREIDEKHVRGGWMDVGVMSVRNLRGVRKKKVVLWGLLGVTSLPLHLFYNSAIFSSIAANNYVILTVNPAFVDSPGNFTYPTFVVGSENLTYPYNGATNPYISTPGKRLHVLANNGTLERLSPTDCIAAYGQNFVTNRNGLLLVVDEESTTGAILHQTESFDQVNSCNQSFNYDMYPWICQQDGGNCSSKNYSPCESRLNGIKANSSGWQPFSGYTVLYCLSEKVPEHCKLQFSFHIGVIVTAMNLVKVLVFGYMLLKGLEMPLMTVGDAIASFLTRPDVATEGIGLLSQDDVVKAKGEKWAHNPVYQDSRRRWFVAASKKRWIICISMYIGALSICVALLGHYIPYIKSFSPQLSTRDIFNLGPGAITPLTFIVWNVPVAGVAGLMSNVLVANTPQLILSLLYFAVNGLVTAMYNAHEWSSYALVRKGLRVSTAPYGAQRSTYFLSLPYRVALPLLAMSGVLHWLVSQSLFFVMVESYGYYNPTELIGFPNGWSPRLEHDSYLDWMTCGWSPVSILCVVVVGLAFLGWIIGLGLRRFKTNMPVVGSCSAAIAAACHAANATGIQDAALERVQ